MADFNPEKRAMLIKFRERVADVIHELRNDFQRQDDNLEKFLIARDYNIDKAEEMVRKTIQWRKDNNINTILERPFCHDLDPYYCFLFPGFDSIGHPLFVAQVGRWDPLGVLHPKAKTEGSTILTQFCEKSSDLCETISRDGKVITRCFGIIDCAGFDYKHLYSTKVVTTGINLLSENARMMIDHYPESLYKIVIVNAPSVLNLAWTVVKPMLPSASLAKVRICGTNADKWKSYLLEHIHPDVLPSQYGGANTTGLLDCRFEVDKDFMLKRDLELLPTKQLLECYIEPRKNFSVDITTKADDLIVWNFKTETHDIGFKVECDDGRVIIEQCKVDAHKFTQKGKLNCPSGAKYTFTWVNSYSYVKGKKLFYAVITRSTGYIL